MIDLWGHEVGGFGLIGLALTVIACAAIACAVIIGTVARLFESPTKRAHRRAQDQRRREAVDALRRNRKDTP